MDGRCGLLFIVVLAAPQWCAAQDFGGEIKQPGDAPMQPKMLVLVDGTVLEGRFAPRPDGYDVSSRAGRMFIASEQVRFTAYDLSDAYKRMQETFSERTPENHMLLARWCLSNKLTAEARREVLDALRLDPNRGDAKRTLAALVREDSNPSSDPGSGAGLKELTSSRRSATGILSSIETRSLAGLSRPVAQDFTRHVQPLLMNKCANSGCHGGSENPSFQLTSSRRGSSPAIAERNLTAVLRQVDFSKPMSSPLLAAAEGTHGDLTQPIFRGRSGSQQIEVLRNWVKTAANDIAPDVNEEATDLKSEIRVTDRKTALATKANQAGAATESASPHGRLLTSADTDGSFMADADRANVRDAFDPSRFNRRFHRTSETTSERNATESADTAGDAAFKEKP